MTAPLDPLLVPGGSGDRPVGDVDADLPGRDQPDWLWPVLVVAFAALIAWLAIFGPEATEPVAESPATSSPDDAAVPVATESDAAPGPSDDDAASDGEAPPDTETDSEGDDSTGEPETAPDVDVEAGVVDPVGDAERGADTGGRDVVTDLDLPAPGFARLDGVEHPIVHSCLGIAPLAPASTTDIVSTHLLAPADDGLEPVVPVVERWFTADGADGVRVDGVDAADIGGSLEAGGEVVDGPGGSFAGELEFADGTALEVSLNPPPEGDDRLACTDTVVTNEPAQFAFPHTRPVVTVCTTGDPAVDGSVSAVLTEGARMTASANADGSHTLRLTTMATALGEAFDLVDDAGELFVDGDRLGYSGLVTDGTLSRDLTFDVDIGGAPSCDDGSL